MKPVETARRARDEVVAPWDELRAARVHKRVQSALGAPGPVAKARASTPLRRVLVALVAAAALLVVVVVVLRRGPSAPVAASARVELSDGSVVELDERAHVVAEAVGPDHIGVRQTGGRASYDITPNPSRTFVVWIQDVRIEVLGTAFRVEELDHTVRVSVTRGRVRVSRGSREVVLVAGEEVVLGDEGAAPSATASAAPEIAPRPEPTSDTTDASAEPSSSAPPSASTAGSEEPTPAELFRRADEARASGQPELAIRHLRHLMSRYPKDSRVTLASFTIGRIEAQRGHWAAAAQSFESCGTALAGEALAEAALAHAAAGASGRARGLAERYLAAFPSGPRRREMERLAR